MLMELLDLLERRVGELLRQIETLRDENAQLAASSGLITQMREENRILSEELQKERALRAEIDSRIETLLAGLGSGLAGTDSGSGV